MIDYPDRVWVTAPPAHTVTSCPREGAHEYIRADIARDAIKMLAAEIADGYGIDRAEMLRILQSVDTTHG